MTIRNFLFLLIVPLIWCCSPKNIMNQVGTESVSNNDNSVHKVVERMPMYGDCPTLECSHQDMLDTYYSNLKYPQAAKSRGLEGKVYLEFIIEKDGSLSNASIVRDIGLGCGQAAIEGLKSLGAWQPGYQKGKPVRVAYVLPVTFKL